MERYLFDLNGFIVVRNVFTADEIDDTVRVLHERLAALEADNAALRARLADNGELS